MLRYSMASFIPRRKYISVSMEPGSASQFASWLKDNGIVPTVDYDGNPLTAPLDYHITIYHSTNRVLLTNRTEHIDASLKSPVKVTPLGFEMFGYEKNIPVLIVEPGLLLAVRDTLHAMTGIHDMWPEWKAHITLSYDKVPVELPSELPTFDLLFDCITIQDIDDDIDMDRNVACTEASRP